MAKKAKQSKKPSNRHNESETNVVRIRASSPSSRRSNKETPSSNSGDDTKVQPAIIKKITVPKTGQTRKIIKPVRAAGGYFKGAWVELRQVRWPNRRATWSLTLAVLAYSAFFVVLVLLLDAGFKYLFELVLGK